MFSSLISLENLFFAWSEFRVGKRGKPDVQVFERHLEDNLFQLHEELAAGTYRHGSYEQFHIFDPKHRIIHKATVRDRVVHHAIYRTLAPRFDRSFIVDSYSCRRGTHAAVKRLEQFVIRVSKNFRRPCWALKLDITKFFDSIDHTILLHLLARRITDPQIQGLLQTIIDSFSTVDKIAERERERVKGVPIGNLTSQLFANVYLNPLDHFMKETLRVPYYLRYTDDFIIVNHDPVQLVALLPLIRSFLHDRLALTLHPRKIIIRKFRQGVDFLGYVMLPYYRVLRTRTKRRMLRRMMINDEKMDKRAQSYLGMLQHCRGFTMATMLRSPPLHFFR